MIFVTVGTHEQPLNRLVLALDELVDTGIITEKVVMQTGYCDVEAIHIEAQAFMSYDEMDNYMSEANVIITHGGPATFMAALAKGKQPIVVPRQSAHNEHVNDHQLEFCQELVKRQVGIKLVSDMVDLGPAIQQALVKQADFQSHNQQFNQRFRHILTEALT